MILRLRRQVCLLTDFWPRWNHPSSWSIPVSCMWMSNAHASCFSDRCLRLPPVEPTTAEGHMRVMQTEEAMNIYTYIEQMRAVY